MKCLLRKCKIGNECNFYSKGFDKNESLYYFYEKTKTLKQTGFFFKQPREITITASIDNFCKNYITYIQETQAVQFGASKQQITLHTVQKAMKQNKRL